jgi:hypothetical protein
MHAGFGRQIRGGRRDRLDIGRRASLRRFARIKSSIEHLCLVDVRFPLKAAVTEARIVPLPPTA